MGNVNIFQKLDQDIANQLQQLEAQQQELLEKKESLQTIQEDIQTFLNSAQEIKTLVESEPDLFKYLRLELSKIFSIQAPTLPLHKPENNTPDLEENVEQMTSATSSFKPLIIEEDDSVNNSTFVDAQGQNKSFS